MTLLRFNHKQIRAEVIARHINKNDRVVCFSCGNASKALKDKGINVLDISPYGDLEALKWFTKDEIKKWFNCFDATSGHLDIQLMEEIGKEYRNILGDLISPVYVPTGSGETLCCLKIAYPDIDFIAVYNLDEATKYSPYAPLNCLVKLLAKEIIFYKNNLE